MSTIETTNPAEQAGGVTTPTPPTPSAPTDDGRAIVDLLKIAGPSVATMSSYTVMQFVDTYMVKQIGSDPVYVAAQGNGGIIAWIFVALALGTNTVINSFVSQNLGAGKPERGSAYAWNGIWLAVSYYVAVIIPATLVAPWFIPSGHSEQLAALETRYATILMFGAIMTIAARSIHHYFYGLHRPGVVLVAAVSGNLVNIGVNAVLIFGEAGMPLPESTLGGLVFGPISAGASWIAGLLGIPAMGISGAAIGTVVGGLVEFAIPFLLFLSPRYAREFGTRHAWRPRKKILLDILRVGWPGGMMFVNELVCWGLLMAWLVPEGGSAQAVSRGLDEAGVEHAGTIANTAGWIALRYMHLSFMPAVGISIGTQALVGKAMGMRRPDIAAARTWLSLRLAMAYMGLCAIIFVMFRRELIAVFINPDTPESEQAALIAVGSAVMIAAAVFQIFDAVAIVLSGALRGAGDTVWPGVATIVLSWGCIVGLGLAAIHLFPELGSMGPWIGASVYIIGLGLALLARFLLGGWRSRSLVGDDHPETASERPAPGA